MSWKKYFFPLRVGKWENHFFPLRVGKWEKYFFPLRVGKWENYFFPLRVGKWEKYFFPLRVGKWESGKVGKEVIAPKVCTTHNYTQQRNAQLERALTLCGIGGPPKLLGVHSKGIYTVRDLTTGSFDCIFMDNNNYCMKTSLKFM